MPRFISWSKVAERFAGRRVAIVGSGPGCAENEPGFVDGHDVVVRVNNFRCGLGQGVRTDVHYSFFGTSITAKADDATLCMSKLPNGSPIPPEFRWWHEKNGKTAGIDYRYIYARRAAWWYCDTFIPDEERFLRKFRLLGNHQPTTGFAAILDVLECEPKECYLTGFDFFTSGIHNVDEPWRQKNADDPIGHRPDIEFSWMRENIARHPITTDKRLSALLEQGI